MMADATFATDKEHRNRGDGGHGCGVVACAAGKQWDSLLMTRCGFGEKARKMSIASDRPTLVNDFSREFDISFPRDLDGPFFQCGNCSFANRIFRVANIKGKPDFAG